METIRVEPISLIEGRAIGELQGQGRWQLSSEGKGDGETTTVRYDWKVETTRRWMNLIAPLARPFFSWNHDVVMDWAAKAWRSGSAFLCLSRRDRACSCT